MAKKRKRVVAKTASGDASGNDEIPRSEGSKGQPSDSVQRDSRFRLQPLHLAAGLLAGLLVYVAYYPSDSVAVEKGDALWMSFLSLVIAAIVFGFNRSSRLHSDFDNSAVGRYANRTDLLLDCLPWVIAGWVMVGSFCLSPPGNLRMATNEAWVWVAAAAVFSASRRLFASIAVRRTILLLMIACASGLAVHALHQQFVSLPQNRMEYQQDPDFILGQAGIDAPEGSTERMVFENRLMDGGPTATFALANSLAAVLLAGVIGSLGVFWCVWFTSQRSMPVAAFSIAITFVCGVALLGTASRSAILATIVAVAFVVVVPRFRRSMKLLAAIATATIVLAVAIGVFGKAEWFEQAPASVSFRLQYWRSTMQIARHNPLFGAGPGNFQSVYERFREDSAHEQIADPHNFLFESLASGGFVAAGGLVVLLALVSFAAIRRVLVRVKIETVGDATNANEANKWVWLGGGLSLVVVWVLSLATGYVPDVEANLLAIPVSISVVVVLKRFVGKLESKQVDTISCGCLLGMGLHLMAAGGWTVPGVAVYVWLLAGILLRRGFGSEDKMALSLRSLVPALVMLMMAGAIYFVSIVPTEKSRSAIAAASVHRQRGRLLSVQQSLEEAIALDPWSVDAMLQKADLQRWAMVAGEPNPSLREAWESSVASAKELAGENPSTYEVLGQFQLHVYQRHGDPRDLAAARETIQSATEWSRANERLHAQLALILYRQGDTAAAKTIARRASELGNAGGVYERILEKQVVAEVQKVGKRAERSLKVGFASELLQHSELLSRQSPPD